MVLMFVIVFALGLAVMVASAVMVILSQVLNIAAVVFAVLNFLVMLALVIVIIVLTRKGKFRRDYLEQLRASNHGEWKYWGMRILQVALWVFAAWALVVMVLCILFAVLKPLDAIMAELSKLALLTAVIK